MPGYIQIFPSEIPQNGVFCLDMKLSGVYTFKFLRNTPYLDVFRGIFWKLGSICPFPCIVNRFLHEIRVFLIVLIVYTLEEINGTVAR